MNFLLIVMLISLLFPIVYSFRSKNIWKRMLCYSSLSTRTAVILVIISRMSHDVMVGFVGIVVLCVGNPGLLLLANLIKAMEDE